MNEETSKKTSWASIFVSALFLLILSASGVGIFLFQKEGSEVENRVLQTFPQPSADGVLSGDWQKKFETFTSDQFPLRDSLTALGASIRYALGARELGGALVGHTSDGSVRLFESFPHDEGRASALSLTLSVLDAFAASTTTDVLLLPVPSSSLVYGDELPPFADVSESKDIYSAATDTGHSYDVIACLPALLSAKSTSGEELFFRTDHHWTVRGAGIAYKAFCDKTGLTSVDPGFETVNRDFCGTLHSKTCLPFIIPDTVEKSDLDVTGIRVMAGGGYGGEDNLSEISLYHTDALSAKDKYQYFLGGNYGLAVIENTRLPDDAPSLIVLKDSFANAFVPYLTAYYRRIVMVDPRYYRGTAGDLRLLIDENHPSAILIICESTGLADDPSLRSLLKRLNY